MLSTGQQHTMLAFESLSNAPTSGCRKNQQADHRRTELCAASHSLARVRSYNSAHICVIKPPGCCSCSVLRSCAAPGNRVSLQPALGCCSCPGVLGGQARSQHDRGVCRRCRGGAAGPGRAAGPAAGWRRRRTQRRGPQTGAGGGACHAGRIASSLPSTSHADLPGWSVPTSESTACRRRSWRP